MGPAIVGGLLVGFLATSWAARLILPAGIGLIECILLFFAQRKTPLKRRHRDAMASQGMSSSEIAEVQQFLTDASAFPVSGWKLYAWQLIWTSLTALPFSLIAGAIREYVL